MSKFDVRIIKNIDPEENITYYIGEVYFDEEGKIYGCTDENSTCVSDTIEELLTYIDWMQAAELKNIIEYNEKTKEFKEIEE